MAGLSRSEHIVKTVDQLIKVCCNQWFFQSLAEVAFLRPLRDWVDFSKLIPNSLQRPEFAMPGATKDLT